MAKRGANRNEDRKLSNLVDAADQQPAGRDRKPPAPAAPAATIESIKAKCKELRNSGASEETVRTLEIDLISKLPAPPQRTPAAEYNDLLSKIQHATKRLDNEKACLIEADEKLEKAKALQRRIQESIAEREVEIAKLEADRAALRPAAVRGPSDY